jgi:hypothetical protein
MPLQPAFLLAGLLLISGLTGCVTLKDPEVSQEQSRVVIGTLEGGHTVAQSFISRRAKLNGVWLWMNVAQGRETDEAKLILQLFHAPAGTAGNTRARVIALTAGSNPIQFDRQYKLPPGRHSYPLATSERSRYSGLIAFILWHSLPG